MNRPDWGTCLPELKAEFERMKAEGMADYEIVSNMCDSEWNPAGISSCAPEEWYMLLPLRIALDLKYAGVDLKISPYEWGLLLGLANDDPTNPGFLHDREVIK